MLYCLRNFKLFAFCNQPSPRLRQAGKCGVSGFSLLEMSIVLVIIGVVTGGGAVILTASVEKQQYDETNFKMEAIQKALLNFRRSFNRIPCPGDLTLNITNANFGIEAARSAGPTNICSSGTPAATFTSNFAMWTGLVEFGNVPTRTLGLPDEYAFDGWGRRFVYTVHNALALDNSFTTIPIDDVGVRTSVASFVGPKTSSAIYVLTSYGPNGHGAYSRDGSPIYMGSTSAHEWINCNCNATAAGATIYGFFYQDIARPDPTNPLASFDDIVVFGTRQSLRLSYE